MVLTLSIWLEPFTTLNRDSWMRLIKNFSFLFFSLSVRARLFKWKWNKTIQMVILKLKQTQKCLFKTKNHSKTFSICLVANTPNSTSSKYTFTATRMLRKHLTCSSLEVTDFPRKPSKARYKSKWKKIWQRLTPLHYSSSKTGLICKPTYLMSTRKFFSPKRKLNSNKITKEHLPKKQLRRKLRRRKSDKKCSLWLIWCSMMTI